MSLPINNSKTRSIPNSASYPDLAHAFVRAAGLILATCLAFHADGQTGLTLSIDVAHQWQRQETTTKVRRGTIEGAIADASPARAEAR